MEQLDSLEDLLDLQVVDSDIDRLLERRSSLPELDAYKQAHEELSGLEGRLHDVEVEIRRLELESDKAEGELRIDEEKAHREEQRLYAGGLSARDAEHLRAEVEMLRRKVGEGEDRVLAMMEERETLEATRSSLDTERQAVAAEKDRIEAVVGDAWKEIDREIAGLEEKKKSIVPLIRPDLLEMYETIRPEKEGVAIARLGEGVCGACHLALSAAEQVQAAKEEPPRCIHCRRILVIR